VNDGCNRTEINLKEIVCEVRLSSFGLRLGLMAVSSEGGSEPSGSVKDGKVFEYLNKDSAPCISEND
jgi:hypothetical protein